MTEQKEEPKKNVAVDLECDDEFEEFGNEGARRRVPTPFPPPPAPARSRPERPPRPEISRRGPDRAATGPDTRPHPLITARAEWGAEEEDAEDVNQWEEDWDDNDTNDDFTRQLRAELERFA